jgi:SAM-dependent methyltransferase
MNIPGLLSLPALANPRGATLLLIGGESAQATALIAAGCEVARHHLDTGPLAESPGVPFTAPVVTWPFDDASFDVVLLLDQLAFTVREEEALAEAARVLRPGGTLVLRVPADGKLTWLDGFNGYRYVQETSGRGKRLPMVSGVGWRRHYPVADVLRLLRPHFRVNDLRTSGIGLAEATRLGLNLFWRWGLRSETHDAAIHRTSAVVAEREEQWSVGRQGYSLVVVAERLSPDAQAGLG